MKFLNIAESSLEELRYYFILAKDLNFIEDNEAVLLAEEISKLSFSYSNRILSSVS